MMPKNKRTRSIDLARLNIYNSNLFLFGISTGSAFRSGAQEFALNYCRFGVIRVFSPGYSQIIAAAAFNHDCFDIVFLAGFEFYSY